MELITNNGWYFENIKINDQLMLTWVCKSYNK